MIFSCAPLAVPPHIMEHVVKVESSGNPFAIGVVGGRLIRQPRNLIEAIATAKMLEKKGYNFSVGIAQVNRYNLAKYGLHSYEQAFQVCPNVQVGSKILNECYIRSKDWGKAFSCYYSGNFTTGYRHGYVQKIFASMRRGKAFGLQPLMSPMPVKTSAKASATTIGVISQRKRKPVPSNRYPAYANTHVQPSNQYPKAQQEQTIAIDSNRISKTAVAVATNHRITATVTRIAPPIPDKQTISTVDENNEIQHNKTDAAFVF